MILSGLKAHFMIGFLFRHIGLLALFFFFFLTSHIRLTSTISLVVKEKATRKVTHHPLHHHRRSQWCLVCKPQWQPRRSLKSSQVHPIPPPKRCPCSQRPQLQANLDSAAADNNDDRLLQLEHVRSSVKSSKRAVKLCPVSLSFWFFHVVALVKLAQ